MNVIQVLLISHYVTVMQELGTVYTVNTDLRYEGYSLNTFIERIH